MDAIQGGDEARTRGIRMKMSTKTRYGTRLMVELARNYGKGFIQLGEIAKEQDISIKYLEQIMIPLRKARYVEGVRGAKGGYKLARPPEEVTVGEIMALMEDGKSIVGCSENPSICERSGACVTRDLWKETAEVMYEHLNAVTLADLLKRGKKGTGDGGRPGKSRRRNK
jgi:Rrf2 family protein